MVQIKNEIQYKAACERINELLKVVNNDTPADAGEKDIAIPSNFVYIIIMSLYGRIC